MRARALWGGALVALFVGVASAYGTLGLPVLPVYDGVQPPSPYRWMDPPPEFEADNQPPLPGMQSIPAKDLAVGFGAATNDAQAQLIVAGGVAEDPPEGARTLEVEITPLDPDTLGPAPAGLVFAGNAYEFVAIYEPTGDPLVLSRAATIVARYATRANTLLSWTGSEWERVPGTQVVRGSLQVFAETLELGTFVTAGAPQHTGGGGPSPILWIAAGVGGGAVAGGAAWLILRRKPKGRPGKPGKPGKGGAKGKAKGKAKASKGKKRAR